MPAVSRIIALKAVMRLILCLPLTSSLVSLSPGLPLSLYRTCKKMHRKLYKSNAKSRPRNHFGMILVSFRSPWAYFDDLGRPRGPPEGAEAKKRRKREFATLPPGLLWGPWGDLGRHQAGIFFVFGCQVGNLYDDRRFDGQSVLQKRFPRPRQTTKPEVSPTRKRRFHVSTRTSTMIENGVHWLPFWVAFQSF